MLRALIQRDLLKLFFLIKPRELKNNILFRVII